MNRCIVGMMASILGVMSCFVGIGFATEGSEIQDGLEKLDQIEQKIDAVLDQVEEKTRNTQLQASIEENQKEIDDLVVQQKQAIENATSSEEINQIVIETTKRMVLKTYDGVTDKDAVEDSIHIDGTEQEKSEAVAVAKKSLVSQESYVIQLTAAGVYEDAVKRIHLFDKEAQVKKLFEDHNGVTVQVMIGKNSLLSQEVLEGLDEGIIPDGLLGFKVHKPEVYRIESIDLGGEGLEQLWGIQEYSTYRYLEHLPTRTVTVGVVDTGVDMNHPDLKDRISSRIRGYDFVNNDADPSDDHYHGTHVAGTIAGSLNGEGVLGVNPGVEIVPLKICTAQGYCPSYAITNAVTYAADQGIDILNMSLGGRGVVQNNQTCDAIAYAAGKGVIPVVAAGNANSPVQWSIPGGCPQTITVGAYDTSHHRASFSNYGEGVDISAPGVDIYSAKPGGYKTTSGTSMATPHVSGIRIFSVACHGVRR